MQTVHTGLDVVELREVTWGCNENAPRAISWAELNVHWPAALVKACTDWFSYAVGLRGGAVLRFVHAVPTASGDWVHLEDVQVLRGGVLAGLCLERGLDVAVREIIWVVDAPEGS